MKASVVSSADGFRALEPRWDALFDQAVEANPFCSFQWLYSWWQSYRSHLRPHIVLVENDAGELLGLAPLMWNTVRALGIRSRCLEFIGDGTHETDHIQFLVHPRDPQAIVARLLESLEQTPRWNLLRLNHVPERSLTARESLSWCRRRSLPHESAPELCLSRRLPADFESLLGSLQGRFRTKLRSTRRRLSAEHEIEFGLHERRDEFDPALEALFRNHASRWQARGTPGVFENDQRRAFYRRLTRAFAEKGYLRFFYLKLNGEIVAQQYCFEHRGVVYLLQEGFDFSLAKLNIGNLLRGLVFEHLIQSGATVYDFLAGDSPNKRIWSDTTENDLSIAVFRRNPRGFLLRQVPRCLESAKALARKLLPAAAIDLAKSLLRRK